jgi:hypothetical protein
VPVNMPAVCLKCQQLLFPTWLYAALLLLPPKLIAGTFCTFSGSF